MQNNPVIKELNLAYNGFADKGTTALADALKVNSTLKELDIRYRRDFSFKTVLTPKISYNRVTQVGAVAFSKILPQHESLQVLKVSREIERKPYYLMCPLSQIPGSTHQIGGNPIQPSGLSAMLDAIKATSNGTFQSLDLEGITITLDHQRTVQELKESVPHVKISHGGIGGFKQPKPLLPPMAKLVKYCKENKVELLDLFRLFDKEHQMVLSEEDFRKALKVRF